MRIVTKFRISVVAAIGMCNYGLLMAAPVAPSNLDVRQLPGQLHVTWQDNSSGEYGFSLERKINSSSWGVVATLGPDRTSYQMDNPLTFNTYYFRVRAFDEYGYSTYSNTDSMYINMFVLFTFNLQEPEGGEQIAAGSILPIRWASLYNPPSNVTIQYSLDGASTFSTIVAGYPNTGEYYWLVPDNISGECVIKVRSSISSTVYDLSRAFATCGYDFDHLWGTGAQGWTMSAAYDEFDDGPLPDTDFMFNWRDAVENPSPPGSDPTDSRGSIALIKDTTDFIPRWHNPSAQRWYVDFISPPLQSLTYWQNAIGCEARIANCMVTTPNMYCNLMIKVYDHNLHQYRYFTYPLSASVLNYCEYGVDDNWNYRSFYWENLSGFPVDYTLYEIRVRIWGPLGYSIHGGVYLDDVTPIWQRGDFTGNGAVTLPDYVAFLSAWETCEGDPNWNPVFDLVYHGTVCVDYWDLQEFKNYCWLEGAD